MATPQTPPAASPSAELAPRRSDRSPWNWLLLLPILLPLIVPIYNAVDPTWGGWPRFYWLQLLYVLVGVGTTTLVYRMTRRSPAERQAARDAVARDAARTEER
jgi:hypothetical protein